MSLKNELYKAIKQSHPSVYSVERAESLMLRGKYKISNGERRLRQLAEIKLIMPVKNCKGYIVGHLWVNRKGPKLYKNPQSKML